MDTEDVKVSFYLKKSEANESDECPVMARLTIGKYSEAAFSANVIRRSGQYLYLLLFQYFL